MCDTSSWGGAVCRTGKPGTHSPHGKGYFVGDWTGAVAPAVAAFDQPAATSPYSPSEPGAPGWHFDPGSDGTGEAGSGGQG
jgi:hypothetical protein